MSKPAATKSWATGRPKLSAPVPAKRADAPEAPEAAASPAAAPASLAATTAGGLAAAAADRTGAIAAEWAPVAGRILLGVVFAWFGYHELVQPDRGAAFRDSAVEDGRARHRRERRHRRGLPYDAVAAHERDRGVPGPHGSGEVERGDDDHDAERVPGLHQPVAGPLRGHRATVELAR